MLGLAQIPGTGRGPRMLSLTELQSAPELTRLPRITPPQLNPDPVSEGRVSGGTVPPGRGHRRRQREGAGGAMGRKAPSQPHRLQYTGLQRCQAPSSGLLAAFSSGIPVGKSVNQALLGAGGGCPVLVQGCSCCSPLLMAGLHGVGTAGGSGHGQAGHADSRHKQAFPELTAPI